MTDRGEADQQADGEGAGGGESGGENRVYGVRRYDPGDRNAVWAVHDRAFRASPVEFYPELNRYLRRIERSFFEPGGEFIVATAPTATVDPGAGHDRRYGPGDEVVVGIGGYLPSLAEPATVRPGSPVEADGGTAELRSIRVDPDFQRRGVARTLVTALERRARDRGFGRMVLDTGVGLVAAQRLYESLGYERAGRETFHGFELIYYEKSLAAESDPA